MTEEEVEQPDEPDWKALLTKLAEAETWLGSEDGLDQEDCILRTEIILMAWTVIDAANSERNPDETVREIFERINSLAFWVAGECEDDKLREFVARFCDPKMERDRMRAIDEAADTKGTA